MNTATAQPVSGPHGAVRVGSLHQMHQSIMRSALQLSRDHCLRAHKGVIPYATLPKCCFLPPANESK